MKPTYKFLLATAASLMAFSACDYLDVAPAKQPTFEDAMKDKAHVEGWIYSCYKTVGTTAPGNRRNEETAADEFVVPKAWVGGYYGNIANATISPTTNQRQRWRELYGTIGHVHLFLRELERQNPSFLTSDEKELYRAHANFIKAFNYYKLLFWYGPVPIVNEYVDTDTPMSAFPGRSHFDYCVDYICDLLDKAAENLPDGYETNETYGRANKTVCAALKARVLLYAASPLWNGEFPYPNWKNTDFETPGYGEELVSHSFDIEKWRKAKKACEEAIESATANGRRLLDIEDARTMAKNNLLPEEQQTGCWIPGVDVSTEEGEEFAYRVMLMRYVNASNELDGNHENIFTANDNELGNDAYATRENVISALPRRIIQANGGGWREGYCGVCPTLNAVEAFYTKDGKLPKNDPSFAPQSEWLTSAGIFKGDESRPEIIKLNVGREPRFYAWINFDGCDIGPRLVNGQPLRLNLRSADLSGYTTSAGNNLCQTGYLVNKWLAPKIEWTGNSSDIPNFLWSVIRMAELYLNLAECSAELYMHGETGELQNALDNLNIIRKRAGVPELTDDDCNAGMSIRDWVRAERRNELFMEGHRFYDLRRWVVAAQYLSAGVREGLDSFVSKTMNPSIEEFNRRVVVDGDYAWDDRLYLLPVDDDDIYKNPQMVQAPGY